MPHIHSALPLGADVIALHEVACRNFFGDGSLPQSGTATPVWEMIAKNHEWNMRLWAEEDLARRKNVPDSEIVANKRAIDKFNQARNDAIEQIDDLLLSHLSAASIQARLNSETAGAMIDRLSIASLKYYHMGLQAERRDADAEHRTACAARVDRIGEQRSDLASCLDTLLADCAEGRARFKTYRQFKMYNDASLNPWLIAESAAKP